MRRDPLGAYVDSDAAVLLGFRNKRFVTPDMETMKWYSFCPGEVVDSALDAISSR